MESILEQLYHGAIRPVELPTPQSREYREYQRLLINQEEKFEQTFQTAQPELAHILDIQRHVCALETEDMFYYGFHLGAKLLAEILYPEK